MEEPQKGTSSANAKGKKSFLGILFVVVLTSVERKIKFNCVSVSSRKDDGNRKTIKYTIKGCDISYGCDWNFRLLQIF